MKKLIPILFLIITSCSKKDDIIIEEPSTCECEKISYTITPQGIKILRSKTNVLIDCEDDGKIFNQTYYNNGDLADYTTYKCN